MNKLIKTLLYSLIIIAIILIIGYLLKERRIVYNQGATYYVLNYFTLSKFISIIVIVLITLITFIKKIIRKREE